MGKNVALLELGDTGEEDYLRSHKPGLDVMIVENSAIATGISGPFLAFPSKDYYLGFTHNAAKEIIGQEISLITNRSLGTMQGGNPRPHRIRDPNSFRPTVVKFAATCHFRKCCL